MATVLTYSAASGTNHAVDVGVVDLTGTGADVAPLAAKAIAVVSTPIGTSRSYGITAASVGLS